MHRLGSRRGCCAVMCSVGLAFAGSAKADITLTQISTTFNSPIGIDYHESTNSVITSVNYSNGLPHNFERINFDGTHSQFSTVSGLTDELKIATVRSGNVGGFTTGDLFSGNGVDGQILRVSNGGATVQNAWVSLPGAGNGLLRGSLHVDRTGVWGGNLIVATTGGEVWSITSGGVPTFIKDVNTHLEGLMTVPNDVARYGPIAGKIIAGAENLGLLYAFSSDGSFTTYDVDVSIEDIDLINANENFFGVNFGTSRILGAPASEFAGMTNDILLTQESVGGASGLFRLTWNGSSFVTEALHLASGSAIPGDWEHVTFAPAGINEVPPIPAPAAALLASVGLGMIGWARRRS